jgi:hypothetical protein
VTEQQQEEEEMEEVGTKTLIQEGRRSKTRTREATEQEEQRA